VLKDMAPHAKWGLAGKDQGKGSMTSQADKSSVAQTGAGSASNIAGRVGAAAYAPAPKVDQSTPFTKDFQATGEAGPVQEQMRKVQTAHDNYASQIVACRNLASAVQSEAEKLKAATLTLKAKEIDEESEKLGKQKKKIESGEEALHEINPMAAELFVQCKDIYEKVDKIVKASNFEKAVKAVETENYAGAAKEVVTGLLAVGKLAKIEEIDTKIALLAERKKAALDEATMIAFTAARIAFKKSMSELIEGSNKLDNSAREERNTMDDLAKVVAKNWKGNTGDRKKDAEQAKLAAGAIRALPISKKILSLVQLVRDKVPAKLPETSGFNSEKAHTLAVQGVGAPGDAELLTVGGWILGIQPTLDHELEKWEAVVGQLQIVVMQLGMVN
jgi:hypothetical protein